jgi:hypothetical protein
MNWASPVVSYVLVLCGDGFASYGAAFHGIDHKSRSEREGQDEGNVK